MYQEAPRNAAPAQQAKWAQSLLEALLGENGGVMWVDKSFQAGDLTDTITLSGGVRLLQVAPADSQVLAPPTPRASPALTPSQPLVAHLTPVNTHLLTLVHAPLLSTSYRKGF